MKLIVKKLDSRDAGKGIARMDENSMSEMNLAEGDIVELSGQKGEILLKVKPLYKDGVVEEGIIRIDGEARNNAGVSIGDKVKVSKEEVEELDSITLAPTKNKIRVRYVPHFEKQLKEGLLTKPLQEGQLLRVNSFQSRLVIGVKNIEPSNSGIVGKSTKVNWDPKKLTDNELKQGNSGTPNITYEDIGGLDKELEQVREMVELPMRHPEVFERLGIDPPKGVLLHGPPGTGKTMIARAVANEVDAHFESISGPEIMSKYYGEAEEQLRDMFEESSEKSPAIIFIDEIDSIAPNRDEVSGEVERRVVAQLLSLMDGLEDRGEVIVIAATNRLEAVDNALRRGGRFDREIEVGVPDKEERLEILQIHTRGAPIEEEVDLEEYSDRTYGFVGADIAAFIKEAAMCALREISPELDLDEDIPADVLNSLSINKEHFEEAIKTVEPSAMREVFVEVPDVNYDDVGGLNDVKDKLKESIEWPLNYEEAFENMGTEPPKGILLYGPPGTGKTLLAKAVANSSQSNFITVKGPELLNKYVGESEKGVREIFKKARENSPSVIFFDEIDAIAPERGGSSDTQVTERVVSQLLTELDGIEELKDVKVIAATNRPDLIDNALLRTGRLDSIVQVPLPDKNSREEILKIHTRDTPLSDDVNLDKIASRTENYTGSDIESLVSEATMRSIRESIEDVEEGVKDEFESKKVTMDDFDKALEEREPSINEKEKDKYDKISKEIRNSSSQQATKGFQ